MADSLIGPSISTAIGWKEYEAGRLIADRVCGEDSAIGSVHASAVVFEPTDLLH